MLSLIIPCRNEANNLEFLLPRIQNILEAVWDEEYEILVLNHGSTDDTPKLLKTLKESIPQLKEIWMDPITLKLGQILQQGIQQAQGESIITMDGDLSHLPEQLDQFVEKFQDDHDLVIGGRFGPEQGKFGSKSRYLISKVVNTLARFLLRRKLKDYTTGYRGFRKTLIESVKFNSIGFEFHLELNGLLSLAATKIAEIEIDYINRTRGKTKLIYRKEGFGYLKAIYWVWREKIRQHRE